jgi:hypothetical protein
VKTLNKITLEIKQKQIRFDGYEYHLYVNGKKFNGCNATAELFIMLFKITEFPVTLIIRKQG